MSLDVGQIVISKCGHDKNDLFFVYYIIGEYAYLVDGNKRSLAKPKKKKIKHIQTINYIDYGLRDKFVAKTYVLDSDIRKSIIDYKNK